jgi:hypothetical protein
MLIFAFFPAVFSLHQFIEGIVWFSIEQPFHASAVFRYSYILIAFLVWPVLAPLAAAVATTDHWWRRVWVFMFFCGLALVGYLSMKLAGADGIETTVFGHSISYVVKYQTRPPTQVDYAYAVITALPLLFFGNKVISAIGRRRAGNLRLFIPRNEGSLVFGLVHGRSRVQRSLFLFNQQRHATSKMSTRSEAKPQEQAHPFASQSKIESSGLIEVDLRTLQQIEHVIIENIIKGPDTCGLFQALRP